MLTKSKIESLGKVPVYKCHKEVRAIEIKDIVPTETGTFLLIAVQEDVPAIEVGLAYIRKANPEIGGYYVRYIDGYESFSPKGVFEAGYTVTKVLGADEKYPKMAGDVEAEAEAEEVGVDKELDALKEKVAKTKDAPVKTEDKSEDLETEDKSEDQAPVVVKLKKATKDVSLHFTIKDQSIDAVKQAIEASGIDLAKVKVHVGFLTPAQVEAKGFGTELNDYLGTLGAELVYYSEEGKELAEMRTELLTAIKTVKGQAIFVGALVEGVADELTEAKELKVSILEIPVAE